MYIITIWHKKEVQVASVNIIAHGTIKPMMVHNNDLIYIIIIIIPFLQVLSRNYSQSQGYLIYPTLCQIVSIKSPVVLFLVWLCLFCMCQLDYFVSDCLYSESDCIYFEPDCLFSESDRFHSSQLVSTLSQIVPTQNQMVSTPSQLVSSLSQVVSTQSDGVYSESDSSLSLMVITLS